MRSRYRYFVGVSEAGLFVADQFVQALLAIDTKSEVRSEHHHL